MVSSASSVPRPTAGKTNERSLHTDILRHQHWPKSDQHPVKIRLSILHSGNFCGPQSDCLGTLPTLPLVNAPRIDRLRPKQELTNPGITLCCTVPINCSLSFFLSFSVLLLYLGSFLPGIATFIPCVHRFSRHDAYAGVQVAKATHSRRQLLRRGEVSSIYIEYPRGDDGPDRCINCHIFKNPCEMMLIRSKRSWRVHV